MDASVNTPKPQKKLLWWAIVAAAIVALLAVAPPTRTEPEPWTGWTDA